ncbi:Na+/H+ antiporter NhaA [Lacisediminihabitans sp.]|jgi:NhaA family Na+:H+ antiporter|uniref:Na+/H+ antiporter NhaA n=1 Tax=Lacisediminihabitans sp. TaxID=2787631 RepID=UPI002F91FF44
MKILRSERYAAFLLLGAAVLGVILANTAWGPALQNAKDFHLDIPWLGLNLTVGDWEKDGLLAVFFFIAAIELRHELAHGELNSARKALVPTVAAVGGVIVPAIIFLLFVRDPALSVGWPIPTATDIAFALGALALVGRALPSRVRALLLALAVIDDLIAIIIIAAFFTSDLQPIPLLVSVPVVLLFGWLSARARSAPIVALLIVLGIAAWVLVHLSGIHATIAGVALGLIMAGKSAGKARHALEPVSNGFILPVFAFAAALVALPAVGITELSPVFWAIVVALPVGKLIGITGGAVIASALAGRGGQKGIPLGDIVAVAGLGGIGFTVSLLMNELAYAHDHEIAVQGTLAVLVASVIAAVIGVSLTAARSRHYRSGRTTA